MPLRTKPVWTLLLLAAFVTAGLYWFLVRSEVDGDDLSSSYVGCRVVAAGQQNHLYAHDPKNFAAIGPDDPWQQQADAGGYTAFLHPYVQTPLWAYALLPVCRHTTWLQFEWIFATLALLSFASLILLVSRNWVPALCAPLPLALVLIAVWFFSPFQYSMQLMQTHIFFVLAMVAAVMLADRNRPVFAGLLLAIAATVKLTPAVLLVYWLLRKQWKAAASAAVWLVALWLLARSVAGPQLMATYSATIDRVSHTLLLAMNNQSFAAWWVDLFQDARFDSFRPLPLGNGLRLASSALLLLCVALGGWMDRQRASRHDRTVTTWIPLGGLIAMVGATIFAPLEWTHYSIVLIAPLMVLSRYAWMRPAAWAWVVIAAVLLLNLPPLAQDPYARELGRFAILRGHFYAEVLCLAALLRILLPTRLQSNSNQGL